MAISTESLKNAIKRSHAKAVFVINPTYYGIAPIWSIVRMAHRYAMAVLVDEAHGRICLS